MGGWRGDADSEVRRWRAVGAGQVDRDAVFFELGGEPLAVALGAADGLAPVMREVHRERATQRFLALSVSDAAEDVIAVVRAGARGYVTKAIGADELVEAIVRVDQGDAVFSPRLAGFVLDAFAGVAPDGPAADPELDLLTPREREVLRHLARGFLYKEIAQRLGISPKTVEGHVSAVLRKLQLSTRHELSRWAVERRLVEGSDVMTDAGASGGVLGG